MDELDQMWLSMLETASKQAAESGKHGVAEYIRLKVANDAIRSAAVKWLFESFVELAYEAAGHLQRLSIDRKQPHSFPVDRNNMVGTLLELRLGVRCLSVEAGWARTPADGIMRNGSLAYARIRHFGIPRQNADFRLVRADPLPEWVGENNLVLREEVIRKHIEIFLSA